MSTSVASLTSNFFPSAENGFTTTTSGSVSSGAVTVGLNSVAGYTNGEVVVFVIDPTDASKKQTFTGVIDTAGSQVTSVVWTAGTNQTHALGATVVDYATATHISMMTKGITQSLNQDGSLITQAVRDALGVTTLPSGGWDLLGSTLSVSTGYNKGNKEFDITSSADLTTVLSPGMRLKLDRGTTPPTQCTSLNGTTQYWNKTSSLTAVAFTDDFVAGAWVYLTSYSGAIASIITRYNGTSGWYLSLDVSGRVVFFGHNAGGANYRGVTSYQSIPLNKWTHIAAQLDMSANSATTTTSYIMINGKDVPALAATNGTNPAALIQAGNLEIGAVNSGTLPFPGRIAQAFLYSAKVTQATIQDRMSQELTGSETNLIGYWKFNGNGDDTTANALNLTAQGSATATTVSNPFNATEMFKITKVTASTITVFGGEDYQVPNMTLSNPYYSTQATPFGFNNSSFSTIRKILIGTSGAGSAGAADYLGMTHIFEAMAGIKYRVTAQTHCTNTSALTNNVLSLIDGSTTLQSIIFASHNTINAWSAPLLTWEGPLSAGSHTLKLSSNPTGGGTLTMFASGSSNIWATLIIEALEI